MRNYIPAFYALLIGSMILCFAMSAIASYQPDNLEEDRAWSSASTIKADTCDKELNAMGDAVKYQNCFSNVISTYVLPHAVDKTLTIGLNSKMLQPASDFDDGKIDIKEFRLEESKILSDYFIQRSDIIESRQD